MTATDGAAAGDGGGASGGGGAAEGAAAAAAAAAGGAEGGAAKAYYESFADETLRTDPGVQLFKSSEELAKGYVALQKRFGIDPARRLDLPADGADEAAMREVWTKLGLPEKADGYGLELGEGATDADKSMLGKFTEFAHKAGFPANFAKAALEFWAGESAGAVEAQAAQLAERRTLGEAALKTEFGAAHETRMREITNLIKTQDPKGEAGLTAENLAMYPGVTKLLAKVINRMAEPGVAGGQTGDAAMGDVVMSPAQAGAALVLLNRDPIKAKALADKDHPQHAAVITERRKLLAMKDGRSPD
jgi:hypothetical protein